MLREVKWYELMLDTETMGGGDNGAIIQIGARFFIYANGKEELGPSFLRNINLGSAMASGGTVDAPTIMFWLRAGEEARKSVAYGGEPIVDVLNDFRAFVEEHSRIDTVRLWGNAPRFDITKLESAYRRLGQEPCWWWRNEKDLRMLRMWYGYLVPYDPEEKGATAHNALADADFQISHVWKVGRALRHRKAKAS